MKFGGGGTAPCLTLLWDLSASIPAVEPRQVWQLKCWESNPFGLPSANPTLVPDSPWPPGWWCTPLIEPSPLWITLEVEHQSPQYLTGWKLVTYRVQVVECHLVQLTVVIAKTQHPNGCHRCTVTYTYNMFSWERKW